MIPTAVSLLHVARLYCAKNGWTDQGPVWYQHSWGRKAHRFRRGSRCLTASGGRFDAAFASIFLASRIKCVLRSTQKNSETSVCTISCTGIEYWQPERNWNEITHAVPEQLRNTWNLEQKALGLVASSCATSGRETKWICSNNRGARTRGRDIFVFIHP